jgi:hypothetical protein
VSALVLLAALMMASDAFSDGDPASDVLVNVDVYLSEAPTAPPASTLVERVRAINAAGYRLKVAVIASPSDLGSVPSLYGRPRYYARFLGIELGLIYKGSLLIAMPAGFGFYHHGRQTVAEDKALGPLRTGSTEQTLVAATLKAVNAVTIATGHPVILTYTARRSTRLVRVAYQTLLRDGSLGRLRVVLRSQGRILASSTALVHGRGMPSNGGTTIPVAARASQLAGLQICTTLSAGGRTSISSCRRVAG